MSRKTNWEQKKVAGKTQTGFSPSDQDEEESEELKESVTEQNNELGAKNEEEGKRETRDKISTRGESTIQSRRRQVRRVEQAWNQI